MILPKYVKSVGKTVLKQKMIGKIYSKWARLEPPSTLWFDDGYIEDYTVIFPMLERYNLVGVLSIVTERIGKKGFLDIDKLRIMQAAGWKIASHSVTHSDFATLNLDATERELRESKEWIENNLDTQPDGFMPPNGVSHMSKKQRKLCLKYYRFICSEPLHFHSRHFRDGWQPSDIDYWAGEINANVANGERTRLMKFLENIEANSAYFKAEAADLELPTEPDLPDGYVLKMVLGKEITARERSAWELLNEKKWKVPDDALVFFIEIEGEIVGTEYAISRNGVGTLHAAIVKPQHRKHGFYSLMSVRGMNWLIEQRGISTFELHTGVKILWHFWKKLGFRKVYDVSAHAKSGYW